MEKTKAILKVGKWSICEDSGKRCYTLAGAVTALHRARKHHVEGRKYIPKRYYVCPFCGEYHLTHCSKSTKKKRRIRNIYK